MQKKIEKEEQLHRSSAQVLPTLLTLPSNLSFTTSLGYKSDHSASPELQAPLLISISIGSRNITNIWFTHSCCCQHKFCMPTANYYRAALHLFLIMCYQYMKYSLAAVALPEQKYITFLPLITNTPHYFFFTSARGLLTPFSSPCHSAHAPSASENTTAVQRGVKAIDITRTNCVTSPAPE